MFCIVFHCLKLFFGAGECICLFYVDFHLSLATLLVDINSPVSLYSFLYLFNYNSMNLSVRCVGISTHSVQKMHLPGKSYLRAQTNQNERRSIWIWFNMLQEHGSCVGVCKTRWRLMDIRKLSEWINRMNECKEWTNVL